MLTSYKNILVNAKQLKFLVISFCLLLFFTICFTWLISSKYYATNKAILLTFKKIDTNLIASNSIIKSVNKSIVFSWQQRLREPSIKLQSAIWYPKIDLAFSAANSLVVYIEKIKIDLQQDKNAFLGHETILKLRDSLVNFSRLLVGLFPERQRLQLDKLPIQTIFEADSDINKISLNSLYFSQLPSSAALAVLSKLQNDVLQSTYIVEKHFDEQISYDFDFQSQQIIINQNSMVFIPGQTLEIRAGIGAFITTNKPKIFIDEIPQEIGEDGVAIYKKSVGNKLNNEVRIKISFVDPNTGRNETATKIITYNVFDKLSH